MFVEMFSEVIAVFSLFRGSILTYLLWSFKLYHGAKMYLILITLRGKYDSKCQSSFDNTPVQSVLKNNKNPLAYKEQNGKGR